jgi:hypothetical protein
VSFDLLLRLAVTVAAVYCLIALTVLVARTFSFKQNSLFAKSQGSRTKGVIYAFGQGMLPWEKESASKHLPTFFGGILYHLGIAAAVLLLVKVLLQFSLPGPAIATIRVLSIIGLVSGIGLLIKRTAIPYMRFISTTDDFIANILVELLLLAAIYATFYDVWYRILMIVAITLLLYIPVGKIRHCFFFFYSRIVFGKYFGRRGTLPHPSREA